MAKAVTEFEMVYIKWSRRVLVFIVGVTTREAEEKEGKRREEGLSASRHFIALISLTFGVCDL